MPVVRMSLHLQVLLCDIMRKVEKKTHNLWELKPLRLMEWENNSDGNVVVLIPKFKNAILKKWVLPKLAKPFFRVKLDETGSAIWLLCDGNTTVVSIAEELKKKFGKSVEPVEERIGKFLYQLERGDLIKIGN